MGLIFFLGNGSVVGMEPEDIEITVKTIDYKTSPSYDAFSLISIKAYKNTEGLDRQDLPGTLKRKKVYFDSAGGDNASAVGLYMWVTSSQIAYLCTQETLLTKSGIERLLKNSGNDHNWNTVKKITLVATMSYTKLEPSWGENVGSATCTWDLKSAQ